MGHIVGQRAVDGNWPRSRRESGLLRRRDWAATKPAFQQLFPISSGQTVVKPTSMPLMRSQAIVFEPMRRMIVPERFSIRKWPVANQLDLITIDAVLALARRNWSYRRIAEELNVHRGTVSRYVQASRAGFPTVQWKSLSPMANATDGPTATAKGRKSKLSPLRDEILAQLDAGASIKDIHSNLAATGKLVCHRDSLRRFVGKLKQKQKCRLLCQKNWMTAVFHGNKSLETLE